MDIDTSTILNRLHARLLEVERQLMHINNTLKLNVDDDRKLDTEIFYSHSPGL